MLGSILKFMKAEYFQKAPRGKSDVPVTYKIGWWNFQKGLSISGLKSKVVFSNLNVFRHTALIEYQITGSISERPGFCPLIKEVNINERWLSRIGEEPLGEIILTPIVGVKNDDFYLGEAVSFEIKVQAQLSTANWGKNKYTVRSGEQSIELILEQIK